MTPVMDVTEFQIDILIVGSKIVFVLNGTPRGKIPSSRLDVAKVFWKVHLSGKIIENEQQRIRKAWCWGGVSGSLAVEIKKDN